MTAKRPALDEQDRAILKNLEMPWYVDEATGNPRVRMAVHLPELFNFLKRKGYRPVEVDAEHPLTANKARVADMVLCLENLPNSWTRDDSKCYLEIRHPEMKDFILQEVLGITPQQSRSK